MRRPQRAVGAFTFLSVFAFAALPANAQRVVPALEIGGSQMRYGDTVSSAAAMLTPAIRLDWDRATVGAAGTFSMLDGQWSSQGSIGASIYAPLRGVLVGELAATFGGSAHEDRTRTGQTLGLGRLHLMGSDRGVWGGLGLGTTWDGVSWRRVRVAEVAAWTFVRDLVVLATLTPAAVDDSLRYSDGEVAARWDFAKVEAGFTAGVRAGDRLPTLGSESAWGSVTGTWWVMPRLAIVASGGTYPMDLTQGFPGGRFVSLGVRLGARTSRRAVDRRDATAPSIPTTESPYDAPALANGIRGFRLSPQGGDRHVVRVHAPSASRVELSGDFTGWEPVRLTRASGGWWIGTFRITAGVHEVNVRVDDGRWVAPPGLATSADEFGGVVGLLSVPGGDAAPH